MTTRAINEITLQLNSNITSGNTTPDKSVVLSNTGIVLTQDALTTPLSTTLNPEGFINGANPLVTFNALYQLKEATPSLRIPLFPNIFLLEDTIQVEDETTLPTRGANISAVAGQDPRVRLQIVGTGETADLTQNGVTYLPTTGGTAITETWENLINGIVTPYQLFFNYSVPYTIPSGATYSTLSQTKVATPTTIAWTTNSTAAVFLGGFFNLLTNVNIQTSIPAGIWSLLLFANLTSVAGIGREAFFFTIIGTASTGAETILYTSPASLLLNTTAPLIGSVSVVATLPVISLVGYTGLGVKLYIQSNTATLTTGSVIYQTPSAYSSILTSFTSGQSVNSLDQVLSTGNIAIGTYATITLNDTDVGGQANPILTLNNSNATGSVAMEVYKQKPGGGTSGDVLFNQSVYGNDTLNTKQEYTRTTHTIRDATGGGGEDGSIEFSCFVNGAVATFLQLNGVENEVNCLKVLDMGGNNIRTTTGSLTITTAASTGTGTIIIEPKSSSVLDIAGNATMTGTRNLFLGGGTNDTTFINNTQVKVRNNNLGNVIESTHSYNGFSSTDTTTGVSSNISNNALTLNGGIGVITTYSQTGFLNSDNSIKCNSGDGFVLNYGSAVNKTTLDLTKLEMYNTGASNQDTILLQNSGSANPVLNLQTTNSSSNLQYAFGASTIGMGILTTDLITSQTKGISINNPNSAPASISYSDGISSTPFQITSSTSLNLTTANDLILDGTNIISGSFGANSGQFLRILLNGTYYKIRLYND